MSDDDERHPLDLALDLVFYAPLGLALTAAEELPHLADKGRRRFTRQWATAKVVGQFAVAQGRKQAEARLGGGSRPATAPGRAAPTRPVADRPGAPGAADGPRPDPAAPAPPVGSPVTNGAVAGHAATNGVQPGPPSGPVPDVADLAIPGYDSLSASQVVQRLAGLTADELEAVRAYETGTRGRRTILTRVAQLQND